MGVLDLLYALIYIPYSYIEAAFRLIEPSEPKSLQGQIALITGGGKGIGRETALQLAAKGATVILWDVDEESVSSTLRELRTDGKAAHAYTCDVSNLNEVKKVGAEVRRDVGEVDILVNNAGICIWKRMLDMTEREIRKTLDVNLLAQFWTITEFLPMMVKQNRGNIVNVASIDAFMSSDYLTDYGASTYGVRGMTENLEQELKNQGLDGIKLTTVYPSLTNTAFINDVRCSSLIGDMKIYEPSEVAAAMVNGIQLDQREVFVSKYGRALSFIQGTLPRKGYQVLVDCLKGNYGAWS